MSIITKVVSSNPAHCEVYSIHLYVIKFVSDLRQISRLVFPGTICMVSSANKTDRHDITEILLKVVVNPMTLIRTLYLLFLTLAYYVRDKGPSHVWSTSRLHTHVHIE